MCDYGSVWSLRNVKTFVVNPDFRQKIIARTKISSLREYWDFEFSTLGKDAINPVSNKLDTLLSPESALERVFSEPKTEIDFNDIMFNGKILICRFSKGELKRRTRESLRYCFYSLHSASSYGKV